jgi:preprotein translocase subunit SecB
MTGISPIQLSQAVFTDVQITAQEDAYNGPEGTVFNTQVQFGAKPISDDHRTWNVIVRVNMKPTNEKKPTYLGTVECVGLFQVHPQLPKEQIERFVFVNGTSLLYGSIRELVSTITARGPWPMITLVSQSFAASYEEHKQSIEVPNTAVTGSST